MKKQAMEYDYDDAIFDVEQTTNQKRRGNRSKKNLTDSESDDLMEAYVPPVPQKKLKR